MRAHFEIGAVVVAWAIAAPLAANAQSAGSIGSALSSEQQEADYRVIAARCGTPAYEKAFFKQSKAAVAAGLVSKNRDPADVEKTITALRRSPFVLVAAPADCADQLKVLAELRTSRSNLLKSRRAK
jgi:alkylated DNA nucleotide flippase Atl1